MIKLKGLLTETTVRLSTMKDANFEPGQWVQILGKKGMVKLDKNSVKYLAKWIRNNSGKHGMGWSFTEGKKIQVNTFKDNIKFELDVEKEARNIIDALRVDKKKLTPKNISDYINAEYKFFKSPQLNHQVFMYIKKNLKKLSEEKINEGVSMTLPNGVKVKIDFKGVTFISRTSKPVFLDRDELHKFFKATTKYLRYS